MKLESPINNNYCATIVQVKNIIPLTNCDNIVSIYEFGTTAIVSKDTQIGDMGVLFPTEVAISDAYCYENNLYRHNDKNKDQSVKGYIEDNRRVRAIKFRGNSSNALFMPLESLLYTGVAIKDLRVGDAFDTLSGKEICRKYEVSRKTFTNKALIENQTFRRIESKLFPEHFSTDNYFKWGSQIGDEEEIIVTQKLHGTSIRIGNVIVKKRVHGFKRFIAGLFGIPVGETEYDGVYGSRKVIKDVNNPYQNHFYDSDIWTEEGQKYSPYLPKGYIVYGELIGTTNAGTELQKDYTYGKSGPEMYVYRICIVNADGYHTDLSWDQVKEFCVLNWLNPVPELWRGKKKDFNAESFLDKRLFDEYRKAVYLGDNDLVDEGVCIRTEGLIPNIYKAKSPKFLEHETTLLDNGIEDLESSQS